MENNNKRWFFYNEKGEVYLIYIIEPPKEILEQDAYVIAEEAEAKKGFTVDYSVDIKTKELKTNYTAKSLTIEEKLQTMQDTIDMLMMGGVQ